MIGDFDVQSAFEHGFGHLREQPVWPVDRNTGGLGIGQQSIHRRRRQQLGQLGGSIISRGIRLGQWNSPVRWSATTIQAEPLTQSIRHAPILRKTLTWDQGKEMANHIAIAEAAQLDIYFCDPHSPWQRGTNENTNGLLRQYFAKGTDLSVFPADYLDYVAAKLNNRPRQTLGWKTPAEALDELLSNPSKPPAVANTA
jgi:IS30 family transposase